MNKERIRQALEVSLQAIAPELNLATLNRDADLREEIDLDSMDFLKFIRALHEQLGLEIPEQDYRHLSSFTASETYLAGRLA